MESAIALLALSAPITAAIIQYVRPSNGGVSKREFMLFIGFVRNDIEVLRGDIRDLRKIIDSRL